MAHDSNRQNQFALNFKWQEPYLPIVSQHLQEHIAPYIRFKVAPPKDDMERCMDLILTAQDLSIAVRLRRDSYTMRDFTIRYSVPSDAKTEIHKLRQGFGQVYFYGWVKGNAIPEYIIVDMANMRQSGLLTTPRRIFHNTDKTSFVAYSIAELRQHNCLVIHHKEYT